MNIVYIFHCPVHGDETDVLCFRAFEDNNRHLWVKFEMMWHQDEWRAGELEEYLRQHTARAR